MPETKKVQFGIKQCKHKKANPDIRFEVGDIKCRVASTVYELYNIFM
jgi:hypothetical protein